MLTLQSASSFSLPPNIDRIPEEVSAGHFIAGLYNIAQGAMHLMLQYKDTRANWNDLNARELKSPQSPVFQESAVQVEKIEDSKLSLICLSSASVPFGDMGWLVGLDGDLGARVVFGD
mmetsp:Transcript_65832/g.109406  ORF Transcript_65832/g.109406 Transcript_65832/m.109406 type:complete len:118 (-) Transcript_65832:2933-3286(-)